MGSETEEHVAVCTVLSVEAGSCVTSAPHAKLAVCYVGFIHFATSAIR